LKQYAQLEEKFKRWQARVKHLPRNRNLKEEIEKDQRWPKRWEGGRPVAA